MSNKGRSLCSNCGKTTYLKHECFVFDSQKWRKIAFKARHYNYQCLQCPDKPIFQANKWRFHDRFHFKNSDKLQHGSGNLALITLLFLTHPKEHMASENNSKQRKEDL